MLLQQGRTVEAETALRKALAADPFEKEAYHRLGTLYLRQARTEEGQKLLAAFERLRQASDDIDRYRYILTLYPEDADARYNLGVLYAGLGHFPAAAAEYQQTLAINPADLSARNNLANIFFRQGKIAAAIGQYEKILELNSRYVQAYYNLGNAYMAMGDVPRATQAFQKTIKIEPNHADAHYSLGMIYLGQDRKAEGEAELAIYRRLTE